jgi:hypothetical protein
MHFTTMRRAILVFLLAASICFQGIALAGQVIARDRGGDAAHAMLHADAVPHHHHRHDGSIHKDQSTKSKQHVQNDNCASVAGIPPSAIRAPELPQPSRETAGAQPRGHDSAFIEGLKRPPRTIA